MTVPCGETDHNHIAARGAGTARRTERKTAEKIPSIAFCRVGELAHHLSLVVGEYTHPTEPRKTAG
jgi:hypothetical protein